MLRNAVNALLIGFAVLLPGGAHAASLVTNGNFDTGDFTGWVAGNGIAIDSVFPNSGCCDAAFTATDQSSAGTLSQTIATNPGGTYALGFALVDEAGLSVDSFNVTFGGFNVAITGDMANPFISTPGSLYTNFSYTVPAADIANLSTSLIFEGLNDPTLGINWNLDDVTLSCTDNCAMGPSPTPIPSTLSLFTTAVILWFGVAYFRRRQFSV
jgi:hypothetical protein